jgi:predicted nuclease of predicted toxin-antitoxin system
VLLLRRVIATGSVDPLVWQAATLNNAILVAIDGDMKQAAKDYGIGKNIYAKTSLIKLSCREPKAAERVVAAMALVMNEWETAPPERQRRIFIEIGDRYIKTNR